GQKLAKNARLGAVRRAHQRGVVKVKWHLVDGPVVGSAGHGIDDGNDIAPGRGPAFVALSSQADNQAAHRCRIRLSSVSSLRSIPAGPTGWLISRSQITAAAIDPSTEAITGEPVATSASAA